MSASPLLAISALGAFQITRSGDPAPKFKYLDARELLVYLVLDAAFSRAPGKSKQEIGAALWGDLADAPLNARFKARLNDARRVLGDRAWIVFENETYRFDAARGMFFDVHAFSNACDAAETSHRTGSVDAEYAARQEARSLYRGDFMQDYHTRSSKELYGEREWYLVVREELQLKYRRALERLTQLELNLGHPDAAIELLRQRVAFDEYDDRAHEQLMLELALRGKRSQALRHYHNLVKQRADTPPDAELAALSEKIKRGEPLAAPKSADANPASPSLAGDAKLSPPLQLPADLPRFVGRVTQFDTLRREILHASDDAETAASPICLVGMGGIGKTSLAIHTAYRLREQFPDGVLWGNLRESEPLAILASWERAFGCDFSSLPDLNARAASLRSLLHDKRVLVVLDDVVDASGARPLLLNGAHTRTVFTSRSAEIAAALGASIIEMPVLDADESADLITRVVGPGRVAGQEPHALAICELLGHLPLALDITAHRLVSRPHWTLREMADRLRSQMRRLDELQLADRAVRATFALSWDALNDAQQNVLAHVGLFQARSFTAAALAYVAERAETETRDLLDGLVALSLLSFETNTRYRQHPLLADFSREKLQDRQQTTDIRTQTAAITNQQSAISNQQSLAHARLSAYYLQFATENRRRYLELEEEWDNLNVGIEIAHAQRLWQTVIDYGDVLTDAWFARGRFTDARRNYPYVMQAARELEEQDPYIAATLNWGKACIEHGDYPEAQEHVLDALQTSREVNDAYGMATALYLLARLEIVQFHYDAAQPYLQESEKLYQKSNDLAGLAQAYYFRARIHMEQGAYTAAEEWAERALAIQKQIEPNRVLVLMLRYMGRIEDYLEKGAEAIAYSREAIALAESLNDLAGYAQGLYDLAAILRDRGTLEEAREIGIKSAELLRKIGDRKLESYVNEQLTIIEYRRQDFPAAVEFAKRGIALSREIGDMESVAYVLIRLGDAYESLNRREDACRVRSEALPLAKTFGHPRTSEVEAWLGLHCSH